MPRRYLILATIVIPSEARNLPDLQTSDYD